MFITIRWLGNSVRSSLAGSPLFIGNICWEYRYPKRSLAPSIHHWIDELPYMEHMGVLVASSGSSIAISYHFLPFLSIANQFRFEIPSDLTTTSPGRWWLGFGELSPFMAQQFRLVTYSNLPRYPPVIKHGWLENPLQKMEVLAGKIIRKGWIFQQAMFDSG